MSENITTKATQIKKSNNLLLYVLLVLVLVISTASFIMQLNPQKASQQSAEEYLQMQIKLDEIARKVGEEALIVKEDKIVKSSYSSSLDGVVKNISKRPLRSAIVEFKFILNGEIIDIKSSYFGDIGSYEERPFSIYISDSFDYDTYEFYCVEAYYAD